MKDTLLIRVGVSIPPLLVVVHLALLVWAVVGMAEWVLSEVPWPMVSNPAFPPWLLLLHWLAILSGSIVFLSGYIARWRATPLALAAAYTFMAVVCVIETFWFLTGIARFVAMALEFAVYMSIIILLLRLPPFVRRFSGDSISPGGESGADC